MGAVIGSQLLPQFLFLGGTLTTVRIQTGWILLVPPAWFAGFDDLIAAWPADANSLETLLASADLALYAAKAAGRNRAAVPELAR